MSQYSKGIKFHRERVGLTQQQLADKIGRTQKAVGFYETGLNIPDGQILARIADALGVGLDDLRDKPS